MTQLHSFYPTEMGKIPSYVVHSSGLLSTPVTTTTTSQTGQLMLGSAVHSGLSFEGMKPPPSLEMSLSALKSVFEPEGPSYSKRIPNCQKCGQHSLKNRLKGHKRACPYKDCDCTKCQIVTERQKLMADQIKIRRRQRKDSQSACVSQCVSQHLQSLTAALNAANTGLQYSNVNNMQSLSNMLTAASLGYNLKTVPQSLLTSPASSDGSSYSPTALNSFNSSPDILKNTNGQNQLNGPSILLQASNPPSPQGILAPVAINPIPTSAPATLTPTSVASAFSFPFSSNPIDLLNILASYKLFEQIPKFEEPLDFNNIDVCT